MRRSAPGIVVDDIELDIVVKPCASDWPDIEEEMESEIPKIEGYVLAASNVGMEPLTRN